MPQDFNVTVRDATGDTFVLTFWGVEEADIPECVKNECEEFRRLHPTQTDAADLTVVSARAR